MLSEAAFHNLMIYDKLYVGCLCKKQTLKNEEISILVDNLKKIKLLYKENKVVYDSMLWEMQEELNIFDGENIVSEVLKHFEDYPINSYLSCYSCRLSNISITNINTCIYSSTRNRLYSNPYIT